MWGHIDMCLDLIARQADARVTDKEGRSALTHFGSWEDRTTAEEIQERQQRLIAAWLAGPHPSQVAQRNWDRRKHAMLFLVGSHFAKTAAAKAAAKVEQEQADKHVKLDDIPRGTKEQNLAYLQKEVFGHEGIQRCIVGML